MDGPNAFRDRRGGMIFFGIVQLVMAICLLAMTGMQLVMATTTEALAPGSLGSRAFYAFSVAFYLALSGGVAWLGIGSILCRRWARALTLVLAWMGLAAGLLATILMLAIARPLSAAMYAEGESAATVVFVLGCLFVFVVFFYLVLPGVFVLFYRSPHVKATCDHHDPVPRWTDRYPLPVLAGGILLLWLAGVVFAPLAGMPLPLFGVYLTGAGAWAAALLVAGLTAVAARGYFRLERWAWHGALGLIAASCASALVTFGGDGLARMYEAMQVPASEIEEMEALGLLSSVSWIMLPSTVALVAFYWWLGRYFREQTDPGPASLPPQGGGNTLGAGDS